MARYLGPKCKLSRREGTDLLLKSGVRDHKSKCKSEKQPGQHADKRPRLSGYGEQLRQKQRMKRIYGVLEKQFRNYYKASARHKGATGENLLAMLESRLDNVVYRMGLSNSRRGSRQMVSHGHFIVNDKRVTIPSYEVKVGDIIKIREGSKTKKIFDNMIERLKDYTSPTWVSFDASKMEGKVLAKPKNSETFIDLNAVLEFYSR